MVVNLRYIIEFGSFWDPLRKSGWRYAYTLCDGNVAQKNLDFSDISPMGIFAEVTENEYII